MKKIFTFFAILLTGSILSHTFLNIVHAAPPVVRLTQGIVAHNSPNPAIDFLPNPYGPETVSPVGSACPRFAPAPVINSTQLASQSFDSDLRGPLVNADMTMVATIENTSPDVAYDVRYNIVRPSEVPSGDFYNLCVYRGDGILLTEDVGLGGDYFLSGLPSSSFNLEIKEIAPYNATSGENIVFITYDAYVDSLFSMPSPFELQYFDYVGSIINLAETPGGPDLALGSITDAARVYMANAPAFSISNASTTISSVTVGDLIEYRIEYRVPERATTTASSTIRIQLDPNTSLYDDNGNVVNPVQVFASSSIRNSNTASPLIDADIYKNISSNYIELELPRMENQDEDLTTDEKIVVMYTGVVTDDVISYGSTVLDYVEVDFPYPWTSSFFSGYSSTTMIREPGLILGSQSGMGMLYSTSTNASSTIDFTIELYHQDYGVDNLSDAHDVRFYLETNGPGLTPLDISNVQVTGLAPDTITIGSLLLEWSTIPASFSSSSPIVITFTGTLPTTTATTTFQYPIDFSFSSLPGTVQDLSSYNALARERSYINTFDYFATYVPSAGTTTPPIVVPPPVPPTPCVGVCGGGTLYNPGCMDPNALNYDKWATLDNGSCKYPQTVVNPPNPTDNPGADTKKDPITKVMPTYIPKNKTKKMLELTGNPRSVVNTRIRNSAIALANSEGNRLRIRSLNIQQPVLQLDSITPLLNESWILPDNSTPDKPGNTVIVGHSYGIRGGKQFKNTFFDLANVKTGEKIEVDWKGKTYVYEVFDNQQFAPNNVWLEDDTVESVLTIYSCGRYTTAHRQVVRAYLKEVRDMSMTSKN